MMYFMEAARCITVALKIANHTKFKQHLVSSATGHEAKIRSASLAKFQAVMHTLAVEHIGQSAIHIPGHLV